MEKLDSLNHLKANNMEKVPIIMNGSLFLVHPEEAENYAQSHGAEPYDPKKHKLSDYDKERVRQKQHVPDPNFKAVDDAPEDKSLPNKKDKGILNKAISGKK